MKEYADLEINLQRQDNEAYQVRFRFHQPGSETDVRPGRGTARFNLDELATYSPTKEAYGKTLTESLFVDPTVRTAYAQALANAQGLQMPLRLRLLIDSSAVELNSLAWETLRDPQDGSLLSTDENILFSRYLSSLDWRPLKLRPKGQLRTLIAVANPSNLAEYNLAAIDVAGEISHARDELGEIPLTVLSSADGDDPPTLRNIFDQLRVHEFDSDDGYDILYIVCHGTMAQGEPWLWLQGEDGLVQRVSGRELVTHLKELAQRPRLVVLASCQSAGDGSGEALTALGPQLAQAGVPAVLAMQGQISIETLSRFMATFFKTLSMDGQVDRAATVARGAVRHRPDYWMPTLFMRLRRGRIWYTTPADGEGAEFEKWDSITSEIEEQTCTALIGPGLTEPLLGPRREIALRWARKHGYPLAPSDQEDLPRVAQFVVTRQSPNYLRIAYREALRDEILRRYTDKLPDELRGVERWTPDMLQAALQFVADAFWANAPDNPYRHLARLRLPIYITASPTDLLKRALIDEGADPVVRLCPWNDTITREQDLYFYEGEPTPQRPLIYHLFGHIMEPFSQVMTEDEYFDYLIGVSLNKDLIPSAVRAALTSTTLLFLGFHMDDWNFRLIFRMIMAQPGSEQLEWHTHATAQIEPEEGRIIDAQRARRYLERYFDREKISLYWGGSEDFLRDLWNYLG